MIDLNILNSEITISSTDLNFNKTTRFDLEILQFKDCVMKNFELKDLAYIMAQNKSLKENTTIWIYKSNIVNKVYSMRTLDIRPRKK